MDIPDFFCVCLIHDCMSKCVCILVCAYVHYQLWSCCSTRLDLGGATPTKRRRRRASEPERTPTSHSKKTKRSQELSSSSTAVGSIQINDVDPDGRFVSIKNTSDKVC